MKTHVTSLINSQKVVHNRLSTLHKRLLSYFFSIIDYPLCLNESLIDYTVKNCR